MRIATCLGRVTALVLVVTTAPAAAQPAAPPPPGPQPSAEQLTLAESLFREGKRLFDEGNYAEACPKFAESLRLDPGGGTLLNLARCHELEGKIASAWAEYGEALAWAQRNDRKDRIQVAQERIDALGPRLSRVTVTVPPKAMEEGLEVRLNGTLLGPAALGVATPMDPGTHVFEATAPGKVARIVEVRIEREQETHEVTIPVLEDAPVAEAPLPPPRVVTPLPLPPPPRSATEEPPPRARRTAAFVAGGVGLAGLAVGGAFGIRAISKMSASDDECPDDRCTAEGAELSKEANRSANVANVGVGVGLLGIGVGTVLLLTDPARRDASRWQVEPEVGPVAAALRLRGHF